MTHTLRRPWRFVQTGARDDRLDFMRGYAILVMLVNHIVVTHSVFHLFSGNVSFYISAAEVFFTTSGVVLGMISAQKPAYETSRRMLKRAFELYLVALFIALVFALIGWFTDFQLWFDSRETMPALGDHGKLDFVLANLTGHNLFHGGEILFTYSLFILFGIFAVCAFHEKRPWIPLVASALIYAIGQLDPSVVWLPFDTFPLADWQPLFIFGLFIGYHRAQITAFIREHIGQRRLEIAVLLLALFFILVRVTGYALMPQIPTWYTDGLDMYPGHLALAILYLAAAFVLVTRLWRPLHALLGWLVMPLGRQSLWAFTMHIFVIVIVINLPGFTNQATGLAAALWHALAVALVWGSVKMREWAKQTLPRPLTTRPIAFGSFMLALFGIIGLHQITSCSAFPCPRAYIRIDDTSRVWRWQDFAPVEMPQAYGGLLHVAQHGTAVAEASFFGTDVELFAWRGSGGGKAEIFLDDRSLGEFDFSVPRGSFFSYRMFTLHNLTAGHHTIRVVSQDERPIKVDYLRVRQADKAPGVFEGLFRR